MAHADPLASANDRANALRVRLGALQQQAAAAVAESETVHEDLEQAVGEALSAEAAFADAEVDHRAASSTAEDRVRSMYKSGGRSALYAAVLRADNPYDAFTRVTNISAIVAIDSKSATRAAASVRRAKFAVAKFDRTTVRRLELERRADAQTAEVGRLIAAQEQLVASADGEVQALIEEQRQREEAVRLKAAELEARRLATLVQTASTGDMTSAYQPAGGTYACPAGTLNNFIDSWHAPRSGGRLHQGTDVFATYGAPALAVTDGVVDKWGNGGLGGITLWIRGTNGDRYYYAHNSQNLAPVGTTVRAGDVIALVGQSGNAAGTPPHIHFEAHPGGGGAANPYPFLAAICGKG